MVLAPLLTGLVLLAAFFAIERRVRDPLLPPGFILEPVRLTGLFGMFLAAAARASSISCCRSICNRYSAGRPS